VIYIIKELDGFYVVEYFGTQIIKKKTLTKATKALAAFAKGKE